MKHAKSAQTGHSRRKIYGYLNQKISFSKNLMLLYGLFTMLINLPLFVVSGIKIGKKFFVTLFIQDTG